MKVLLFLSVIFYSINPVQTNSIFDDQDTLTILCNQFPLFSLVNDTSLQCARLRIDANVPSMNFNLINPSQIILFVIIDQSLSSVDITINFNQSLNFPSSINEIRLALLVTQSNFTINNQTTSIYSSSQIPILHWTKSQPNTYERTGLLSLNNNPYKTDTSLCQWNYNQWNSLFIDNSTSQSPYAYILTTTNTNLSFILADPTNITIPSPYLKLLYCIPYSFGTTELVLSIIFGLLFLLFLLTLIILHYLKGTNNISQYFQQKRRDLLIVPPSVSSIEYID